MDNFIYYLQHLGADQPTGSSLWYMFPAILPVIGGFILSKLFGFVRGNKKKLWQIFGIYLLIAMIIPIALYIYSGIYLKIFPLLAIGSQILYFCFGLLFIIPAWQQFYYKTDSEFQASEPQVNNFNKIIILYPQRLYGVLNAWLIALVFIYVIFFQILFLIKLDTAMLKDFHNIYLQILIVCFLLMMAFLLFLRWFPICPYCQFGLFDVDLRHQNKTKQQQDNSMKQFISVLNKVMFLKKFRCRYCNAPFALKKSQL